MPTARANIWARPGVTLPTALARTLASAWIASSSRAACRSKARSRSAGPRTRPCRSCAPACSPPSRWISATCRTSPTSPRPSGCCSIWAPRRPMSPAKPAGWCCTRRAILTDTAPYDLVRKMRASVLVLGPLLARTGAARGLAARRLRHRHAADRPAPDGPGAAGCQDRARGRLRPCAGSQGAGRRRDPPAAAVGGRDREPADGGGAGAGRDPDRRCRARARDRRSRRLPGRDGGEDRRCRLQQHPHRGRRRAARRQAPDHPRPDRGRDLCHGGRGHRRQHRAQARAARPVRRRQGRDRSRGHAAGSDARGRVWPGSPMAACAAATP